MRTLVFKTIKYLREHLPGLLISLGILDKMVLVRIDGGICSQIHFYLLGKLFEEKGFLVKYDISWFKHNGYDVNHLFVRKFDLLQAFPNLSFRESNFFERLLYRTFEYYNDYFASRDSLKLDFLNLRPPVYLTGYYKDPPKLYNDIKRYFTLDFSILDANNLELLKEIRKKTNPIAIHVRRGDLSNFNPAYGAPVDSRYFKAAIELLNRDIEGGAFYYFFSDEPSWVEKNLVPNLPLFENYKIVNLNGSDKGYMDLFLIAACKHQITSKGSLGKYGGFLCSNEQNKIIVLDDPYERAIYKNQHPNIIFLSCNNT